MSTAPPSLTNAQIKRRLRAEILKLIYENHESQRIRLDDLTLFSVMERLQFDAHLNLVRELLQDLRERGFVKFAEDKNRTTGEVALRQIQILPRGCDILEKTISDPAVDVVE